MRYDEIITMPEGEELDALIAERVMGWHIAEEHGRKAWYSADGRYQRGMKNGDYFEDDEDLHLLNWHPSQSILWAWEVVEKLTLSVVPYEDGRWHAADGKGIVAYGETAPLAICRAALLIIERDGE
jgi:hypothetical protein